MRERAEHEPAGWDEEAPPPVSVCVLCGLATCAGCRREAPVVTGLLPWEESRRHWLVRLWQTARVTALEPERTFGELPPGGVAAPLLFAVLAETLAIGSLLLAAAGLLWLGAPDLTRALWRHPVAVLAFSGLLVASVALMLLLHLLWGVSLDVGGGRRGARLDLRQGARFGCYACGWDLMTSPLGLVCSLLVEGPFSGWTVVARAARAARPAQRAYLEGCQGFGAAACRRALRVAVLVVGAAVLALGVGVCGAVVWLAHRLGY